MAYENLPRLPDPTTVPAGPGFVSLNMTDNIPGLVHQLNNGGVVSVQFNGAFWSFQIGYHELTPQEGLLFFPFLNSVAGGFKDFYVQIPLYINPRTGVWDVSTATKIAQGAIQIVPGSDNKVSISNWATRGGDLSIGDMIKFTNSNKIYQIVDTSLVSGTKTLTLNCSVIEPAKIPTAGLEPNDIKFRVRTVEGSTFTTQFTSRGLYEPFTLNVRENII